MCLLNSTFPSKKEELENLEPLLQMNKEILDLLMSQGQIFYFKEII